MRRLLLLLCLLTLAPLWGQELTPEERQAEELLEASTLATQLGDRRYTVRRLPEFESTIQAIDARAEELRRRADVVRSEAQVIREQAERVRANSRQGRVNMADIQTLIEGAVRVAGQGAEIGGEAAELGGAAAGLGVDASLLGLEASRLGLRTGEAASYYSLGLPNSALRRLELDESDDTSLQLARMKAAQASGQTDLALRYGQRLQSNNPLIDYIRQTQLFQSQPTPGLDAHLAARRRALDQLSQVRFRPDTPTQQWRWALEAQSFWLHEGSRYPELEVEDLRDQEFELWAQFREESASTSYELLLGVPELAFLQADLSLRNGDLSQAESWYQQGQTWTDAIDRRLASVASDLNSRYPDMRVQDSPRLLTLQGTAARTRGRLAAANSRPAEAHFQAAQQLFQQADAPAQEIDLLIDWPKLEAAPNARLATLGGQLDHPFALTVSQINDAELALLAGDSTRADSILVRTLPEIRASVAEVGVTPREKHHYSRAFALKAQIEAEQGRSEAALSSLSEQGRLRTAADLGSGLRQSEVQPVQKQRTRLRALREERSAQKALPQQAPEAVDSGALIASNKQEFVSTARELRETHPEYASMLFVDPVEFSKLQPKIPEGTLVLQYFPAEDGTLYIFAVTRKEYGIRKVNVESDEIGRLVRRYRSIVGRFPPPTISWKADGSRAHDYAKVFYRLHELLIEPVEAEIAGAKTLAIVPSGYLHYLPFAGLARPQEAGPEFLIQRKNVVALSKASDLALLDANAAPLPKLVAYGNPDGSLPGAAQEVKQIKEVFPSSTVVVGAEATKARLKADSPNAGYLHLATHGTLNNRDPNASYITMAGREEAARLHPAEIFSLPLSQTRLVTMSACSTALGRTNPGAEVTSLAEAFWVAGAPSVVASLWRVSDDSTRELMVEFYRQVKAGQSLAEALRQAQVAQLQGEFAHPAYWAAFVLLGDWR